MKNFRDMVEKVMTPEELMASMESNFKKHFPNGYFKITYEKDFVGDYYIDGTFGMIEDIKDVSFKIRGNDKMLHGFIITQDKNDSSAWKFDSTSSRIYIKPEEGSYYAVEQIKTKMGNNKRTTLEKVDKKMEKFFKKLSGIMQDNIDNIMGVEHIDKKYLIFK